MLAPIDIDRRLALEEDDALLAVVAVNRYGSPERVV
jgi:hypothetical protein